MFIYVLHIISVIPPNLCQNLCLGELLHLNTKNKRTNVLILPTHGCFFTVSFHDVITKLLHEFNGLDGHFAIIFFLTIR